MGFMSDPLLQGHSGLGFSVVVDVDVDSNFVQGKALTTVTLWKCFWFDHEVVGRPIAPPESCGFESIRSVGVRGVVPH